MYHALRSRSVRPLLTLLLATIAEDGHSATLTVGQPGEPGCSHPTLQSALDAAAAAPGLDIIRVSAGIYTGQALSITAPGDIAIEGGWLSCTTPVSNAGVTTLSGAGASPSAPVLDHLSGNGRLTLTDLAITGGVFDNGSGGGIRSSGLAALTLRRVHLYGNRASFGGGLAVSGVPGTAKQVELLGITVNGNTATTGGGGGLYALNASIFIGGDLPNQFHGNWAQGSSNPQGGGALLATNTSLLIHSLAPAQGAFMGENVVLQGHGGALSMTATLPGVYDLTVINRDGSRPLRFADNTTSGNGGALSVRGITTDGPANLLATLYDSIVEDNDASQGGAFHVQTTASAHSVQSAVRMLRGFHGQQTSPCPDSLRCNRVEGNGSSGAIVMLSSGNNTNRAHFTMFQGHLLNNLSPNAGLIEGDGTITIDNSLVAGNVAGGSYLTSNVGGETRIRHSTLADNIIFAPQVNAVILVPGRLTVHNSIVFQPGKAIANTGSSVITSLHNLLVGSGHGLVSPGSLNVVQTANPVFVAPAQGNYQLQAGSPARDRYTTTPGVILPTVDLRGASRPVSAPGSPAPYDFGAYEYGGVVDPLFFNGFDD